MYCDVRNRGMVFVWVAVVLVVIIGLVGLACDAAYIYLISQQLHNAADAAALAGAQRVRIGTEEEVRQLAFQTAMSNNADATQVMLSLNEDNAPDGDIVIGRYHRATRTFTPTLEGADAVKVVAKRPDSVAGNNSLSLLFGPVFGVPTARVTRYAIAMNITSIGPAILVLDPNSADSLHLNGNSFIDVPNGSIQVNSTHDESIVINGTPDIYASDLNVCASEASADPANLHGNLNRNADYVPDPLEGLPFPTGLPPQTVDGPVIYPGYYADGITLNNGSLRLEPGIYVLAGDGLDVTGGIFEAEGVMLCITGDNQSKLNLDLTGNGRISISPMTPEQLQQLYPGAPEEYAEISIFQDPALESDARMRGDENLSVEGTIYIPSGPLDVGGTASLYGNQLIVNTLSVQGNSSITVSYEGDFPGAGKPFLVE